MSTTILVDGNAVAYTVPVASCNSEQEYSKKFFSKIREYSKQFTSMVKVIVFFDDKVGGTWRDELYPDYQKCRQVHKEKRTAEEEDIAIKRSKYLDYIKSCFDRSKYTYLSYPHTETDDLISLYCNYIQEEGETVIIATTDKDLYQLIRDTGKKKVQVLSLVKHKVIKDEKEGKQALENKIMLGDASDNIPSVCNGVGQKYYPDFKIYLKNMKDNDVNPNDADKAKKLCESLNIKYIKSFTNFDKEQLKLNKKLIDLQTVCELDEKADFEKTNYIKENLLKAKVSPYSLYNIK